MSKCCRGLVAGALMVLAIGRASAGETDVLASRNDEL